MAALCMMFAARSSVAQTTPDDAVPGTIRGTVTDTSGSVVVAAFVTLQPTGSAAQRTTITDQAGSFHFSAVEPGTYALTITAGGFTDRKTTFSVVSGENPPLPPPYCKSRPQSAKWMWVFRNTSSPLSRCTPRRSSAFSASF